MELLESKFHIFFFFVSFGITILGLCIEGLGWKTMLLLTYIHSMSSLPTMSANAFSLVVREAILLIANGLSVATFSAERTC